MNSVGCQLPLKVCLLPLDDQEDAVDFSGLNVAQSCNTCVPVVVVMFSVLLVSLVVLCVILVPVVLVTVVLVMLLMAVVLVRVTPGRSS